MSLEEEPQFYEPGRPETFGKPIKPPTWEDLSSFNKLAQHHADSPEAYLRLFHGQDPGLNAFLDIISRDRFLSAFPRLEKGVGFILEYLPLAVKEYGIEETLRESIEDLPVFYDEILSKFWQGNDQIYAGGLETMYIFFEKPPEEQSYEYIGEMIGRAIRGRFHQDRSYKTQAFFGWIGRQVMKKVCPETDFSFDRHCERAEKEKAETLAHFREVKERFEKGIEGEITLEKCYEFFRGFYWEIPGIDCAETPLQYRIADEISGFDDLPGPNSMNNFENFWDDWQETASIGIPEVKIKMPWEENFLQEKGIVSYETWLAHLQTFISSRDLESTSDYYRGLRWLMIKYRTENVGDVPQEEIMAWYKKVETRNKKERGNHKLYCWRRYYANIFGELVFDLEKMASISRGELISRWFAMHCQNFLEGLGLGIEAVEQFETTYFRFIEKKPTAEGYALAQGQIKEILANLPEIIRMPEGEVYRRFLLGEPKILSDESDYGYNSGADLYKDDYRYRPFDDEERERLSEEDKEWLFQIECGPSAILYQSLQSFDFTPEQWILGINPLFFGFDYNDREAKAFFMGRYEEFIEEERRKTQFAAEERKVAELKTGAFSLPQNLDDLLDNLELHRKRLLPEKEKPQTSRRLIALRQVEEIIKDIRDKGLLEQSSD